jgi:hypothetical protein
MGPPAPARSGRRGDRRAAAAAHVFGSRLASGRIEIDNGDGQAVIGESGGGGGADSAGCAGDDGHAAISVSHVVYLSVSGQSFEDHGHALAAADTHCFQPDLLVVSRKVVQ